MKYAFAHDNLTVTDLKRSLKLEKLEIYFITDPDGYKLEVVSKKFSRSN